MGVRSCEVSFKDHRGMKHSVTVDAETLNEAVVMAVVLFRKNPWIEAVGRGTLLDIEVREPGSRHSLTLGHVERWIDAGVGTPADQARKARLKMMLVQGG